MPANDGTRDHDVAVIGCGLMGTALAKTFAKSGYSVAAWNRTPERAEAIASDGVEPVRSIVDAVRSTRLVVACTTTYASTLSALQSVDSWNGTTLVNLASGTPHEAGELERWATERDAEYLDGNIIAYPQDIGSPDAVILYSGPAAVWSKHESTLAPLGTARHVAEDVATSNLLFLGLGAFYIAALGAYVEAATYVHGEGASVAAVRETSALIVDMLRHTTEEASTAIESGEHETDQATLETYAEAARSALAAMRSAGQRARILAAAIENMDAAEAADLGKLGFYAQTQVMGDGESPGAENR